MVHRTSAFPVWSTAARCTGNARTKRSMKASKPATSAGSGAIPSSSASANTRGQRRVQLGADERGQIEPAVRGAQEHRPPLIQAGDRFARQVVERQQPAAVRRAVQRSTEQRLEDHPGIHRAPAAAANSAKRPAQALISLAPLLQCTIATRSPAGVVTRSSSWCTRLSWCSSTTMAKMLVPALTLPVRGATELVATIPVPASPSGGHTAAPAASAPDGSSNLAPVSVHPRL